MLLDFPSQAMSPGMEQVEPPTEGHDFIASQMWKYKREINCVGIVWRRECEERQGLGITGLCFLHRKDKKHSKAVSRKR